MADQLNCETIASPLNELTTKLANVSIEGKSDRQMENTDADVCCGKCCEAEENNDVNNDDDDDDNNDVVYDDIDSSTPSHFNSSDHLFHINFLRSIQHIPTDIKRFKNGTRKSCTFTNEQMRQIERENRILLEKILSHGPSKSIRQNSASLHRLHQVTTSISSSRVSSAAVNRKKRQQKIDFDNDILRRKIERISKRPTK